MIDQRGAKKRILLSVPHMGGREQKYVRQAFTSNWLSTVGPNITAFEQEFEKRVGLPSVALGSGTAGIFTRPPFSVLIRGHFILFSWHATL